MTSLLGDLHSNSKVLNVSFHSLVIFLYKDAEKATHGNSSNNHGGFVVVLVWKLEAAVLSGFGLKYGRYMVLRFGRPAVISV